MKKKTSKTKNKKTNKGKLLFIVLAIVVVLGLLLLGKLTLKAFSKPHVLGAMIGPLLTDNKDNPSNNADQTTDNPNSLQAPSNGSANPSNQSNLNSNPNSVLNQTGLSQQISPNDSAQVYCVGPDGKSFVTKFDFCRELNQKWGNSKFNFTILGKPQDDNSIKTNLPEIQKPEIKNEAPEIAPPEIKIKEKPEILTVEKLQNLNEHFQINGEDTQIGSGSANNFSLQTGSVEAQTKFPLTVSNHTLIVTTPQGQIQVAVLPNQAVEKVLSEKLLSNILSSSPSNSTSSAGATQTISLTQINNETAFAIPGIADKKLFGIFPVGFSKTVYVSTTNGNILQTKESLLNKFLESLSF